MKNENILEFAHNIKQQIYPDAVVAFAAGSVFRGEGNEFSDIDLVVLYDENFEDVRRESFKIEGWPVEAFVQNKQSLDYFLDKDRKNGMPIMINMIREGIEIPGPCPLSQMQKAEAERHYALGPLPLSEDEMRARRYHLSDMLDDLRGIVKPQERYAILAKLYINLADFHLRAAGNWSGSGKGLARALKRYAPEMAEDYFNVFEAAYCEGNCESVINLAKEIMKPYGGNLFFYKQGADPDGGKNFKGPRLE